MTAETMLPSSDFSYFSNPDSGLQNKVRFKIIESKISQQNSEKKAPNILLKIPTSIIESAPRNILVVKKKKTKTNR